MLLINSCEFQINTDNDILKNEINNNWDQFIEYWEGEDVANLVSMYTEDGINVPPGFKKNTGRAEITEFYTFLFSNNKSSKYKHEIKSIRIESKMAIEYGEFEVEWIRNDGSEWVYRGRSMTHWVLSEEGDWKIKMFLFNNPPED
jgi:ketosteroid isomerase-like protein